VKGYKAKEVEKNADDKDKSSDSESEKKLICLLERKIVL
jgi:hypothetical protein